LLSKFPSMKHVTIVIPDDNANLSSITGAYEILSRANDYWQRIGNAPRLEIHVAGFVTELKLDAGFFSLTPSDIRKIKKTDLLIIPSLNPDYVNIIKNNQGSGVRIRNSWNIDIVGGTVALNKNYAFQIYEDPLEGSGRNFEIDPVTLKADVRFSDINLQSNGGILKTNNFDQVRFEGMNLNDGLLSHAPFAGDLKSDSALLADYIKSNPSVIEIKSGI